MVAFSPILETPNNIPPKNGSIYIATGSMIIDKFFLISCVEALLHYDKQIYVSSGKYTSQLRERYDNYSNVHFYEFAPQMELLRQSSVFITHGGSNSICEAIVSRTPMIVIPLENDEFLNAEMIVESKIGLRIENSLNVTRDTLVELYAKLSSDSNYVKRLNVIAHEINPNKVWRAIDKFIEDHIYGKL